MAAARRLVRAGVRPSAVPSPLVTGAGLTAWEAPISPAISDGRFEPRLDGCEVWLGVVGIGGVSGVVGTAVVRDRGRPERRRRRPPA